MGQAIKDRDGILSADDADHQTTTALEDFAAVSATAPMTSIRRTAKTRWAAQCQLGTVLAANCHKRIVDDVIASAERGRVLSRASPISSLC